MTSDDQRADTSSPDDLRDEIDVEIDEVDELPQRRSRSDSSILFATMLGFAELIGKKPKEEAPVVVAAPTEPGDIDTEGVTVPIDESATVFVPPQPRRQPLRRNPQRRRR